MSRKPSGNPHKHESASSGSHHHAELELLREKITDLVSQNPAKAAMILTDWIHRHPEERSGKKSDSSSTPDKKKAG